MTIVQWLIITACLFSLGWSLARYYELGRQGETCVHDSRSYRRARRRYRRLVVLRDYVRAYSVATECERWAGLRRFAATTEGDHHRWQEQAGEWGAAIRLMRARIEATKVAEHAER